MLGALRVPYDVMSVYKQITIQYVVKQFGVVVSAINPSDYGAISSKVEETFEGYRHIYVASTDNISDKRYEVVWDLMRGGYMKYLRSVYGAQFPNILETDNLAGRIIEERLRIWDNKPMYIYLIQDNLEAQKMGARRLLAEDPSFFDYMP
jgi:hypothetical protein